MQLNTISKDYIWVTKTTIMSSTKSYAAQDATTPLVPWTINRRDPKPHDVQIDIKYCGVCHSDLHFARNDWGMTIYPVVPGHEIVGVVAAVGDHVKKIQSRRPCRYWLFS